jgi:Leucine-rich repeat (LRR) protein
VVWSTGDVAQAATGTHLYASDDLKISTPRPHSVKQGDPVTPAETDEHFAISADNDANDLSSDISGRPQAATSTVVTFPDANLETVIREALNKPSGDITSDDMKTLTSLSAFQRGIKNLTGIEHATNLTTLWIQNNPLSDISELSSLTKLTDLTISYNGTSDISVLGSLTNLTKLHSQSNQISDISPLGSLTNLTR